MPTESLSAHFSLSEMTVTNSGLPNVAGEVEIAALKALCENVLEPIREHFKKPVKVNSGFRNPAVNKFAGGAANSQHLFGIAADIEIPGISNCELWHFITSMKKDEESKDVPVIVFDQCIAELHNEQNPSAGWVHVSYKANGKNRRQELSFLGKGKYVTGYKFA